MFKGKVARSNKQHFIVSLKETLKVLKKGQVTLLIVAEDVGVYLMTRMSGQINQKNILVSSFKGKHVLGKYVGINVNAIIVVLIKWGLVSV